MKVIPYILVVMILLGAGGVYLIYNKTDQPILKTVLKSNSQSDPEPTPGPSEQLFSNHGPAPELTGNTGWINSDPITLAQLRGKTVLVNFWSYSSINCIRALPYLNKWYDKYKDKDFVIIGVHTPEFAFGKIKTNVNAALERYGIAYPVVQDNNFKVWKSYSNQFWPAQYLVNKDGNIVYTQLGEGNYDKTEKAIRTLLGMEGSFEIPPQPEASKAQTSQMYLGLTRLGSSFGGSETPSTSNQIFVYPEKLAKNKFALEGNWQFNQESAVHTKGFGRIKLNFNSAKVYLVAESPEPTTVKVYVDGNLIKGVVVKDSELYELYNSDNNSAHTMEIEVPDSGFEAFTFTFG